MAKEEIRQDTRVSIRTPRARVRGLGVAHHGAGHWWQQRVTAAANVVLMLAFVVIVASMAGRGYVEATHLIAKPLVSIILILALVGALPTWGYSSGWGYGPSGGLGLIVVVRDGHAAPADEELKQVIRARLRSSRVPERVLFAKSLPYNEMGKLLRREIKKLFAA